MLACFIVPVQVVAIPDYIGLSRAGLPIGVQLMGAPFTDNTLARIGRAFQRETSWHVRTPDLHTLMPAKSR